jgi:hypothetical protein
VEKWLGQAWVLLSEALGKGVYLFRSKMSVLNYLTEAPHNYAVDDTNMQVIEEAARSIGGRDTIQEFQACGIWLLSDDWELKVERMDVRPRVTEILIKLFKLQFRY